MMAEPADVRSRLSPGNMTLASHGAVGSENALSQLSRPSWLSIAVAMIPSSSARSSARSSSSASA